MKGLVLLLPWILLAVLLAPITLQIQNHFVYSDSPFLTGQYQSVKADNILKEYFNYTEQDEIYVIMKGDYNQSLNELKDVASKFLSNATIITPYLYLQKINESYFKTISPILNEKLKELEPFLQLYYNLVEQRIEILNNLTWFEYQLNVTYGLGKGVQNSTYLLKYLKYLNETHSPQIAGLMTFNNPYILLFSFNNYTNTSLIRYTIANFNNYSFLIYKLTGKSIPEEALTNPKTYLIKEIENEIRPPPITLANFHKNDTWLFIVLVPNNESLTNVENFIQHINATVTGHLPIYAQSAYYTSDNLKIIDIVTFILVGALLIILLRAILPIIYLVFSAILGIEIAYGLLYAATFFGYQIYYISGLVIPPIVFGITIDYSILLMYRYFEELRKGTKDPLRQALKTAGKGAVFSGLTITVGFATFLISPSPLLRNIGEALVISSLSALIPAVLFNYAILRITPANLLKFPRKEIPNPVDVRQKYLYYASNFSIRHKYLVLGIAIILIFSSLLIFTHYPTNILISEIVPSNSESIKGEELLTSMFNYSVDYVIIEGNPNSSYSLIYNVSKFIIKSGGLAYGPASYGNYLIPNATYITNFYYSRGYSVIYAYIPYPVFSDGAINFTKYLINQGFLVGGSNAERVDIVDNTVNVYYSFTLPFTIIFIVMYLFLVLRSIVVPIRLVLTLLASSLIGVAVMLLVFNSVYWLSPLIVFALLFSLGIDYDMFIILRIKEEKANDEDERIVRGVVNTGLVVTAAGLVLAGAFFSLMSSNMRFLDEIGFSVGFSILFDTFVVRPILVPAVMSILKQYNWWPSKS